MMKLDKVFAIILLLTALKMTAQFDAVAYDFFGSATALQTNPGAKYPYSRRLGVPFLTNIQAFAGSSGFSLADLFGTNQSFDANVYQTVAGLTNTDFVLVHYRHDLFSYGRTDDLERFKYFGLYWETDYITYTPADLLNLGLYGNAPYMDQTFEAKYLAGKAELVQTIYYGVHKNPNPSLNIGYRFKLYSGLANVQSMHNSGRFYTNEGQNNFYIHHLEDIDLKVQSSGYQEDAGLGHYLGKLLFSGNYGPGFDLGVTYDMNHRTAISAAILDLGFIYYTTDINNTYVKGSFQFEGAQLQFPESSYIDYWKDVKDSFNKNIRKTDNNDAYISWRPTTVYAGVKTGLGNIEKQDCKNFLNPITQYSDFIGFTGFAQYRPVKIHLGASAYYEKKWSKYFYTKINITADNFSYSAVGAGLVLNMGALQMSVMADNLIGLSDVAQSRKQAIQFGLNFVK